MKAAHIDELFRVANKKGNYIDKKLLMNYINRRISVGLVRSEDIG